MDLWYQVDFMLSLSCYYFVTKLMYINYKTKHILGQIEMGQTFHFGTLSVTVRNTRRKRPFYYQVRCKHRPRPLANHCTRRWFGEKENQKNTMKWRKVNKQEAGTKNRNKKDIWDHPQFIQDDANDTGTKDWMNGTKW